MSEEEQEDTWTQTKMKMKMSEQEGEMKSGRDDPYNMGIHATYQHDMVVMNRAYLALQSRTRALEQAVRNYHTVIDAMPEFATASDYKRLLAPVQDYAQELLAQEGK